MESTQLIHFPDHHEFLVAKFLFSNAPTAEIPQPVERISIFVFDFYPIGKNQSCKPSENGDLLLVPTPKKIKSSGSTE